MSSNRSPTKGLSTYFIDGARAYNEENFKLAMDLFTQGHESGCVDATLGLARCHLRGFGTVRDVVAGQGYMEDAYERNVLELLKQNVENPQAAYYLAFIYEDGHLGVKKNLKEAMKMYQKSASGGNHIAMVNIGVMYDNGHGVTRSAIKAAEWYHKAAKQGNGTGMDNLARMYAQGTGVKKNLDMAHYWYSEALKRGFNEALVGFGCIYRDVDDFLALACFQRSYNSGDLSTGAFLGDYYSRQHAVCGQNFALAAYYYVQAAYAREGVMNYSQGRLRHPTIRLYVDAAKRRVDREYALKYGMTRIDAKQQLLARKLHNEKSTQTNNSVCYQQ